MKDAVSEEQEVCAKGKNPEGVYFPEGNVLSDVQILTEQSRRCRNPC